MRLTAFALATLLAGPAGANGLTGRTVEIDLVTWDRPEALLYMLEPADVTVGRGPEIGYDRQGERDGFDVVPVIIDFGEDRIDLDYSNSEAGAFYDAVFNGYVFTMEDGCPRIAGAELDPEMTTPQLHPARVQLIQGRILLNVSGLRQDPATRIGIRLSLEPCEST